MKAFTVIGYYESTGQSVCEHVTANNGIHAFWVAAQAMPDLTMVVALPGHLTEGAGEVVFPGDGVVDAGTVLEQIEVFGPGRVEEDAVEVLPGATRTEVREVLMQEIVGDYETPDQVPEWVWVERNASFNHVQNGRAGVWEFVLNLSRTFEDVPERLQPVVNAARNDNMSYLIFHQGT